ncbi:hypothetical protein [Luteolibacter marinus]|uniref:hypothetical protein n=1 Tax=Luteolibacter marinus TaxID=2776705 RepID=UPI001D00C64D|nr:hypothetical protein [Luteolibacter marinus]
MKSLAALLILAIAGCKSRGTPFTAPTESEISSISARLLNRPDRGADIEQFEVPKANWQEILTALDGAEHDPNPMKWQVLGDVVIHQTTGTTGVSLFWTGEEIGAFRAGGAYYRGSSDEELIQVIAAAKKQQSEQEADLAPGGR